MKKIVFAIVFAFISSFALSAQDSAPEEVITAFKAKYPKAKKVEWVKTGDSQWQAEFEMSEREVEVAFDETGIWLGTNTEIDIKKAPEAVRNAVAEKYKGYIVTEVNKVEIANSEIMYKFELDNGDGEIETMFHSDGRIVTESQEMNEEEVIEDEESEE